MWHKNEREITQDENVLRNGADRSCMCIYDKGIKNKLPGCLSLHLDVCLSIASSVIHSHPDISLSGLILGIMCSRRKWLFYPILLHFVMIVNNPFQTSTVTEAALPNRFMIAAPSSAKPNPSMMAPIAFTSSSSHTRKAEKSEWAAAVGVEPRVNTRRWRGRGREDEVEEEEEDGDDDEGSICDGRNEVNDDGRGVISERESTGASGEKREVVCERMTTSVW